MKSRHGEATGQILSGQDKSHNIHVSYIIETTNLSKRFDSRLAVENLNLKIRAGTVFGFLGPNGAGKTTTVRLLNGLLKPSEGTARLFGKDIQTESHAIRARCGVQTDTNLYEKLSAYENLEVWGAFYGLGGRLLALRIENLLKMFGFAERRNDLVGSFSKGMKQKLSVARALINEPEILFLDEPTAGLDPEASDDLLQYLRKYVRETARTVFLCSHSLEEVEVLCDEVAILSKGKILISGSKEKLIRHLWKDYEFTIRLRKMQSSFLKMLEGDERIARVALVENEAHVFLQDKEYISEVIRNLVKADADILSIEKKLHSLKDVYFAVMPNNKI